MESGIVFVLRPLMLVPLGVECIEPEMALVVWSVEVLLAPIYLS
ncbi:hypothetical protein LINPERHAP1_LOCUS26623 [Linum perenne]